MAIRPVLALKWLFLASFLTPKVWSFVIFGLGGSNPHPRRVLYDGPPLREFLPLPPLVSEGTLASLGPTVRVQQFNVLADGLAGRRADLGKFSRLDKSVLDWEVRKVNLLTEIKQYDADIITLQEADHYHDYFQPQLEALGYCGYFAAKPTSACLEVSNNSDGCALFIKRSRLRVLSCETKTLALSIAKLTEGGELEEEAVGSNLEAQNQVAIIAVLEFVNTTSEGDQTGVGAGGKIAAELDSDDPNYRWYFPEGTDGIGSVRAVKFSAATPPPLLVSTVHLKSAKTAVGELYRQKGILQTLNDLSRIYKTLGRMGKPPAVILTGDFNAVPEVQKAGNFFPSAGEGLAYAPLTYRATKLHSLGLRSVYNDDFPRSLKPSKAQGELFTTWKARSYLGLRDGEGLRVRESVVKRCIDYIFYAPYRRGPYKPFTENPDVVATSSTQVVLSLLLRYCVYFFGAVFPSTALISSGLSGFEKLQVVVISAIGLLIFELSSEGSIFRPEISDVDVIEGIDSPDEASLSKAPNPYLNSAGKAFLDGTSKGKQLVKDVKTISKKLQTSSQYGNPGLQAVAALDLLSDEQIGPTLLPNTRYPSDHVSIVADLQVLW